MVTNGNHGTPYDMKLRIHQSVLLGLIFAASAHGAVIVNGVNTNTDAAYGADVSNSDLVNSGASSLSSTAFSQNPNFGSTAHNDGSVGTANNTAGITWWNGASGGSQYSITYTLDTSVNALGYDITEIQSIHGWTSNSGNQKNQNYQVFVSTVGDGGFTGTALQGTGGTLLATVAYLPFTESNVTASTKVNITEDASGILASGVDQIRFIYTVPSPAGNNPAPTIREVDVFGSATVVPEPSSMLLVGLGGMLLLRRRRA